MHTNSKLKQQVATTIARSRVSAATDRPARRRGLFVRSFVRSLWAGVQPTLDPSAETISGPARLPEERKGIGRCVRCVLATCGEGGLSRSEQFVRYFYSAPLLDVAYCLA